ncbi:MAG: MSHA biogenesis protein MshP [Candidatus Endobugula sp.]|jgi:MSHA biogenesis protein MshP
MYLNVQHKNQKGFLLPVALFIIVVLGGMAIIISKKVSQSTSTYLLNSISAQTFYATESGAQAGLHELFYLDSDRQLVDGRCAAMSISQTLNVVGLKNCVVTVSCECRYENNGVCDNNNSAHYLGISGITHSFYTLNSAAQCGVEPVISQHRIEVGASL